jgi:hypothetical protein
MKRAMLAAALLALATPAVAGRDCRAAIIADGIASRGSIVCNPHWLDRPGSLAILAATQSCRGTPETKALIARGFADFDNSVKELGKAAACQKLDANIRTME